MKRIDLHAHTTASDGSLSPARLVDRARGLDLAAVAVTDHDTVDGLPEALRRGRETGVEVVPGIEISAEFKPGTMHVLGYDLDFTNDRFTENLRVLKESRDNRNPGIAARLADLGLPVTMDEARAAAGGGVVGRPHFAKVMVGKGYVADFDEAFDRFLAKGRPAYVEKFRLQPDAAIAMIRRAGGRAVLAHPYSLGLGPEAVRDLIGELTQAGLSGLEVYYPEHDPETTDWFLELAKTFGLSPTGGSDFHGAAKQDVELGSGRGELCVPYALLEGLRSRT